MWNAGGGGTQRARHERSLIPPPPGITTQFHFICHSGDPGPAIVGKLLAAGQWAHRQNGRILARPGDKWTFCETLKAINV